MRRTRSLAVVLGLFIVIGLAGSGLPAFRSGQAMQAVPTPKGQLGGPEPLPSEAAAPNLETTATPVDAMPCDVEPLPVEEIVSAAEAVPSHEATPSSWGATATAEQASAAELVVAQLISCANANDPARFYALFTEGGIARSLQRQGISGPMVPLVLSTTGEPLPVDARAQVISVDRVMASGGDHLRVAFSVLERSGIGEFRVQPYVATLVNAGGSWLIDDIQSV